MPLPLGLVGEVAKLVLLQRFPGRFRQPLVLHGGEGFLVGPVGAKLQEATFGGLTARLGHPIFVLMPVQHDATRQECCVACS